MEDARHAADLFFHHLGEAGRGGGLADLRRLSRAFARLPYENLSKILASEQRRPRLPLEVMTDHLALGTGGTCFSLTELLRVLASAAGLSCHPVMAHMRHGANIHCALRVEAGGRAFLVDPGYLLPRPLELGRAAPEEPETGHPIIVPAGAHDGVPEGVAAGDFDLFTREPDGLKWRYRFSDRAPTREAFMERWLASFTLPGMRSLVATRREEDTRLYLHNHKLRSQGTDHKSTRNVRATLEDSVEQTFGIHPDVTRRARAILDRRKEEWRNGA